MLRRWLIRSPFLFAMVMALALWIVSYFGIGAVSVRSFDHDWSCAIVEGRGAIDIMPIYEPQLQRWTYVPHRHYSDTWLPPTTFGFALQKLVSPPDVYVMVFPFWLPALLLLILNALVWRKTRINRPGQAFPIEKSAAPKTDFKKTTENTKSTETPKHI